LDLIKADSDNKNSELAAIKDVRRGLEDAKNKELKGIDKKTFESVLRKMRV